MFTAVQNAVLQQFYWDATPYIRFRGPQTRIQSVTEIERPPLLKQNRRPEAGTDMPGKPLSAQILRCCSESRPPKRDRTRLLLPVRIAVAQSALRALDTSQAHIDTQHTCFCSTSPKNLFRSIPSEKKEVERGHVRGASLSTPIGAPDNLRDRPLEATILSARWVRQRLRTWVCNNHAESLLAPIR